jgi:hypothetical protein
MIAACDVETSPNLREARLQVSLASLLPAKNYGQVFIPYGTTAHHMISKRTFRWPRLATFLRIVFFE